MPAEADDIFMSATTLASATDRDGENVWQNGDGHEFRVRIGPNYSKNGKKAPSLGQMYDAVGCDVFRTEARVTPVSPLYSFPPLAEHAKSFSHPHVPATFVLNLQVPDCPASFFSGGGDGQTMHVVIFYQIRQDTVEAFKDLDNAAPAYRLFARWCEECTKNDKFRGRFKMIGQVEMCINVHSFPVLTRKSIHSLRGKMKQMVVHLGTTIEGHADDELPERIAFCCRLIRVDGFESPLLSAETISWLQKQAKHLNNNVVVETATSGK
ncbi:hypothetical protein PTSG_07987 [Salpingoeca rosetta]|uniref:Protein ENHANCED DISEASE RESISTANCE 2 C-terminal domain-containing protein n=1 Tax=Salpingoeca rosetta (strain ATCC 50818 / BSB-021) TaxID=946362 RepID=F2UGX5_SALR5|nr:uncharacterized protein PTSG_07987 [Salpingoeca rosetta]EGD75875.1 hypothetical protein PTSG_07987 [Salpingoeca rosetta]|eukprot:XP_004991796.1 hypothetical protein PTSG_07987 [Salpingoeca rosetta]